MNKFLSNLGKKLGNWNDKHVNRFWWGYIDRIAGWLYTRGDRK